MCGLCELRKEVERNAPAAVVHSIAMTHRDTLARQLSASPEAAGVLFGREEVSAPDGCNVEMVLNGDIATGSQTLDVRLPDGAKGIRVTYSLSRYDGSVSYTGNGPEGQSKIGSDAITSALDYIGSKENQLESISGLGIGGADAIHREIEMTHLVKRCLIALREIAEKERPNRITVGDCEWPGMRLGGTRSGPFHVKGRKYAEREFKNG